MSIIYTKDKKHNKKGDLQMKEKLKINLKKSTCIAFAGILAAGVLAACGNNNNNSNTNNDKTDTKNNTADIVSTAKPEEAKGDNKIADEAATMIPQTAEEAANDVTAITNEIESLAELIADGNYDDAMMQIRALLTKNLTDEQKKTLEDYQAEIEEAKGR